jgi:hypothetical protein
MITHVVLAKPKADISLEQFQAALDQLGALQTIIPEILDMQTGKSIGERHQGYAYGLVAHFENEDGLNTYLAHPAHVAAARELNRLCENLIVFDLSQ